MLSYSLIGGRRRLAAEFNMTEDELRERVVDPWQAELPIVADGKTVLREQLESVQIIHTRYKIGGGGNEAWNRAVGDGTNVTSRYLRAVTPSAVLSGESAPKVEPRAVFVVHGRDLVKRDALYDLLRALNLSPIEWEQAVQMTGSTSPTILEILRAGLNRAQAIVILMTGDDLARGNPDVVGEEGGQESPQPRANVLFEAGWAFGSAPQRTIVLEVGDLRGLSDLAGVHAVRTSVPHWRGALSTRLETAGCAVDLSGTDWLSAGGALETV
jgi:predicted nucleotide-binding protein